MTTEELFLDERHSYLVRMETIDRYVSMRTLCIAQIDMRVMSGSSSAVKRGVREEVWRFLVPYMA